MASASKKRRGADEHVVSIHEPSTSSSSSLAAPLLSSSSSSDSSDSLSSQLKAKAKPKAKADKSTVASILAKKEDRSLFKDEALSLSAPSSKSPKLTFRRLLSQAKPEQSLLIGATVCLFIAALLNLAIPAFVGTIIDSISIGQSAEESRDKDGLYQFIAQLGYGDEPRTILNLSVIILVVILVVASLFSALRGYWFTLAGEKVVARLRVRLFSHLASLEVAFFDVTRTGELINRLSADTTVLKDAVTVNVSMALRWASTVVVGIGYLFFISWKLTLVMLSVVPLVAISARFYGKKIKTLSKASQDALATATETAEESISHIRLVRSFSREKLQSALYADRIHITFLLGKRVAALYGVFNGLISLVAMGAMIVVLWYGATLVIQGEMTPGVLTSYVLYTLTVGIALAALSGLFAQWMSALGACDRVFELLDRPPRVTDEHALPATDFVGQVTLDNVRFAYPARPDVEVLKGLSFSLHPGTVTALVGPSGQGKSTVVSLIERFYDLIDDGQHGEIRIDGRPIRQLPILHLHRHIGLVSQNPVMFATTIKENLLYGCRGGDIDDDGERPADVSDEQLEAALRSANAWDFVQSFPDRLETLVGERGQRLSGGQLQRLAITRAILLNPRILIADEATSSLDAESEHLVQTALDRLMQDRTVLVVAHRLSTVKNADNVIVISKGQVAESGTHLELLARQGIYAKLVARQLAGAADESEEVEEEKEGKRLRKREEREEKERVERTGGQLKHASVAEVNEGEHQADAETAAEDGVEDEEKEESSHAHRERRLVV